MSWMLCNNVFVRLQGNATTKTPASDRSLMYHVSDQDLQAVMQYPQLVALPRNTVYTAPSASSTSNPSMPWPFPERPKPPISMIELAALAMYKNPQKEVSMNEIINFVGRWFPYYGNDKKWQASLRQIVSRHVGQCFTRLPRKGNLLSNYKMNEEFARNFEAKIGVLKSRLVLHMAEGFVW